MAIFYGLMIVGIAFVMKSIKLIPSGSTAYKERLGRQMETLKPGLHIVIPFIERVVLSRTREQKINFIYPQSGSQKGALNGELKFAVKDAGLLAKNVADLDSALKTALETLLNKYLGDAAQGISSIDLQRLKGDLEKDLFDIFKPWGVETGELIVSEK